MKADFFRGDTSFALKRILTGTSLTELWDWNVFQTLPMVFPFAISSVNNASGLVEPEPVMMLSTLYLKLDIFETGYKIGEI